MLYSVQQGSRYILSLTNQRSWIEVRRLQHHQQIKTHGQHMVKKNMTGKGEKVVMFSKEQTESLLNLYDNVFIVRILHFGGNNL
jgi:hypothetical protein